MKWRENYTESAKSTSSSHNENNSKMIFKNSFVVVERSLKQRQKGEGERERERERVCVCVCVREREGEGERERECVRAHTPTPTERQTHRDTLINIH